MSGSTEKRGYALKVERGTHPYLYSAEHEAWKRAVLRADDRGIAAAHRAWMARFALRARLAEAA